MQILFQSLDFQGVPACVLTLSTHMNGAILITTQVHGDAGEPAAFPPLLPGRRDASAEMHLPPAAA